MSALFCVLKGVKINDKIFHAEYPVLFGRGNDDDCSWVQAQRKGVCNVQPYSSSAPEPTSVISLSCRLFSFTIHSSAGEPGQYCKTLRTTASPVEKRSGGYGYTNGILAALRLLYHIGSFENVKKTPFSIKII